MMEHCFNSGLLNVFNSFLETSESTALSGSSSNRISAFAYTARARDTRCFWPPDRVTPFSPISVASPFGKASRSGVSWHARMTSL
mmetsp:Transcript_34519/g.100156  ORF Transcript_34519/g.100156 Transcript_34519/m.100156 type:complete len:85 (+) Transcript_34519:527-781(+)